MSGCATEARGLRRTFHVPQLCCLLLLLASALTACSRSPNTTSNTPIPAAWSWAEYPTVEKMRLASLPCEVLPRTSLTISAPVSGQLRVYVHQQETNLPAGFVWAEIEPKELALEGAELEEARQSLKERERMYTEIELPREKIKLSREIAETRRRIVLLELLATNRELAGLALNTAGLSKEGLLKQGTLQQARQELGLMEENLGYLSPTNPAALGVDLQAAQMELERRQLDFDRRQAQSRFKLPFAGQLILSIPLGEGAAEYPVSAGQELAVVRDLGAILLRAQLEDVGWTTLPTDRLTAVVSLPDGTHLEARFAFKKLEHSQMREQVFYYFQFPFEECAPATHLVGTDITCDLWIGLTQPARIVPKLALVLREPAAFQNRHWNEGVEKLIPGAQVLLEGQTDLAILPPVDPGRGNPDTHAPVHARLDTPNVP